MAWFWRVSLYGRIATLAAGVGQYPASRLPSDAVKSVLPAGIIAARSAG